LGHNCRLIAIIDDEEDILCLFKDALNTIENVEIFTFSDSQLAFEHFTINKSNYALIMSDLRMPGMDGIELINRVKQLNPYVRASLMTAFQLDDTLFKDYSKKQIINGFLQKPIRINELRDEVNEQLHMYELQQQKPRAGKKLCSLIQ